MKTGTIIAIGALGLGALILTGKKAAAGKVLTPEPIKQPTIIKNADGTTTITPAPTQGTVIPFPGAKPVQPVAVTVPPNAIFTPAKQVQIYNPTTGVTAVTTLENLPSLIAGGWRFVTNDLPLVPYKDSDNWAPVPSQPLVPYKDSDNWAPVPSQPLVIAPADTLGARVQIWTPQGYGTILEAMLGKYEDGVVTKEQAGWLPIFSPVDQPTTKPDWFYTSVPIVYITVMDPNSGETTRIDRDQLQTFLDGGWVEV